jgi:hypothetical protein
MIILQKLLFLKKLNQYSLGHLKTVLMSLKLIILQNKQNVFTRKTVLALGALMLFSIVDKTRVELI